jgi:Holliday junction resolvase RusA-like endonuclease
VVKGHAYTPENTAAYECMVQAAFRQGNPGACPLQGAVRVEIAAFYAVPKSASKRMQARMRNNEMLPVIRPDWDNIGKLVCDALNGIAWKDDAQVVEASVVKRYGITPMVCVKIEEVASESD